MWLNELICTILIMIHNNETDSLSLIFGKLTRYCDKLIKFRSSDKSFEDCYFSELAYDIYITLLLWFVLMVLFIFLVE